MVVGESMSIKITGDDHEVKNPVVAEVVIGLVVVLLVLLFLLLIWFASFILVALVMGCWRRVCVVLVGAAFVWLEFLGLLNSSFGVHVASKSVSNPLMQNK